MFDGPRGEWTAPVYPDQGQGVRKLDAMLSRIVGAGYWTLDRAAGHFACDERLAGLFGRSGDEIAAAAGDWTRFAAEEDRETVLRARALLLEERRDGRLRFRVRRGESDVAWLEEIVSHDERGRVCGLVRDVTAEALNGSALVDLHARAAQTAAAARVVDRSAGAMALLLAALDAAGQRPLPVAVRHCLDEALGALGMLEESFRALRGLTEPGATGPRPVDTVDVLHDLECLTRAAVPESHPVLFEVAGVLPPCLAEPAALKATLAGLVLSAVDANPGGGTISVTAVAMDVSPREAARRGIPGGAYVSVTVCDPREICGDGGEEERIGRLPSCAGQSLATVWDYLGGGFWTAADPDLGARAQILVAACDHDAAAGRAGAAQARALGSASLILLAEADARLRDHVRTWLEGAGHTVVAARSGDAAMAEIARGLVPDLLVTDLMLPGLLQGPDLAAAARQMVPGLPVLYHSAHARGRLDRGDGAAGRMLAKPVSRAVFLRAVAEMHAAPKGARARRGKPA